MDAYFAETNENDKNDIIYYNFVQVNFNNIWNIEIEILIYA